MSNHHLAKSKRATVSRDAWDDILAVDDEIGPSWTKAYVGGVKIRQYATIEAGRGQRPYSLAA